MNEVTLESGEGTWLQAKMPYVLLVLVLLVSCFMFFYRLNAYPMQNWDEGVHSQVTKEMVDSGDYWTLQYQGDLYFRKPPLKMWLTAPLVLLFGEQNWVYRFWSAFAGVVSVGALYWFIYKKEQSKWFAFIASCIFIGGQFILFHAFRTGEMDGLLMLFTIIGLYAYWRSEKNTKWWLVCGAAFGLAIMAKSLAGVVGPLIVLADILLRKRFEVVKSQQLWVGVILLSFIVLPWHVSMIIEHGKAFLDDYIGFHIVERTFSQLYADLPVYWYLKIAYERLFPIAFFFLGALFISLRSILKENQKKDILLVAWIIIPLLLYTWVKTKFEWYILPVYPALAWMIAGYFMHSARNLKDWLVQATGAIGLFFVFGFLPNGVIPGAKTYWFTLQAYTPNVIVDVLQNGLVLSFIVTGFVLWLLTYLYKKNQKSAALFVYLIIAYVVLFGFVRTAGIIETQPQTSEFTEIASELQTRGVQSVSIYKSDFYDKPAGYFEISRKGITLRKVEAISGAHPDSVIITSDPIQDEGYILLGQFEQYFVYDR